MVFLEVSFLLAFPPVSYMDSSLFSQLLTLITNVILPLDFPTKLCIYFLYSMYVLQLNLSFNNFTVLNIVTCTSDS
jgi:hypothetical protein